MRKEEKPRTLSQAIMMSYVQAWSGIALFRSVIEKEENEEGEKEATIQDPSGLSFFRCPQES